MAVADRPAGTLTLFREHRHEAGPRLADVWPRPAAIRLGSGCKPVGQNVEVPGIARGTADAAQLLLEPGDLLFRQQVAKGLERCERPAGRDPQLMDRFGIPLRFAAGLRQPRPDVLEPLTQRAHGDVAGGYLLAVHHRPPAGHCSRECHECPPFLPTSTLAVGQSPNPEAWAAGPESRPTTHREGAGPARPRRRRGQLAAEPAPWTDSARLYSASSVSFVSSSVARSPVSKASFRSSPDRAASSSGNCRVSTVSRSMRRDSRASGRTRTSDD